MKSNKIITSSIILLAETETPNRYIFGAYKDNGEATSFLDLPEDHQIFVESLTGQQTVMGRATLKATPEDFPDAGRICITHHPDAVEKDALSVNSIPEGIELAKERALERGKDTVFVIGGASIIQQSLKDGLLDEIRLTLTQDYLKPVPHPVYLEFNLEEWEIKKDSGILTAKNSKPENLRYQYLTLRKKTALH